MSFFAKFFGGNGSSVQTLSGKEFAAKFAEQKGIILDVRTAGEFNSGHLKGAIKADLLGGEFEKKAADLDPNKTYYIYCASGNRSGRAAQILADKGFANVYNIGGFSQVAPHFPLA